MQVYVSFWCLSLLLWSAFHRTLIMAERWQLNDKCPAILITRKTWEPTMWPPVSENDPDPSKSKHDCKYLQHILRFASTEHDHVCNWICWHVLCPSRICWHLDDHPVSRPHRKSFIDTKRKYYDTGWVCLYIIWSDFVVARMLMETKTSRRPTTRRKASMNMQGAARVATCGLFLHHRLKDCWW